MVMTYNEALVMPSNYAVMDEEEMTYVEGGGTFQTVAYHTVSFGINAAFNGLFGGGSIKAIGSIIKAVGTDTLKQTIKKALTKWVSVRVANTIVSGVLGTLLNSLSLSVGGVVASWLDKKDGIQDNQIYFSKIF